MKELLFKYVDSAGDTVLYFTDYTYQYPAVPPAGYHMWKIEGGYFYHAGLDGDFWYKAIPGSEEMEREEFDGLLMAIEFEKHLLGDGNG